MLEKPRQAGVPRSEDNVGPVKVAGAADVLTVADSPVLCGCVPTPRTHHRAAGLMDSGATSLDRAWRRGNSLSLLHDTRGLGWGDYRDGDPEAAATCRLLHSHARAAARRGSAGAGDWSPPCGLTVEPGFLATRRPRLKRERPEGKHLERRRPRKPDSRSEGFCDPASGGRAA